MKLQIDILSGAGKKTAAAILVTYSSFEGVKPVRLLLDAGGPLEEGEDKGWTVPEGLDAILISHDHQDHIGGLEDVNGQTPVYATKAVQQQLPTHLNLHDLPVCGVTQIAGIDVTTGSAGHSFGGVWLHLNIANGVFYSGDFSLESCLYAFTNPPQAEIALLDASYGLYNNSQEQCKASLLSFLTEERSLLMPVPQTGRALEMAAWLSSQGFYDWSLAEDCIMPATILAGEVSGICPAILPVLEAMPKSEFNPDSKVVLCGEPDALGGEAAELLPQIEKYLAVYTGHLPEHARQAVSEDRAYFTRWNVHPRKQDLQRLIEHLQCRVCAPLFHPIKDPYLWREALGPSVTFDSYIERNDEIIT
ncbi:MBL fold metallo-hydrolase [Marinomonas epiphytica]